MNPADATYMTNDAEGRPAAAWCSCGWRLDTIPGHRATPAYVYVQWFSHAARCGTQAPAPGVVDYPSEEDR